MMNSLEIDDRKVKDGERLSEKEREEKRTHVGAIKRISMQANTIEWRWNGTKPNYVFVLLQKKKALCEKQNGTAKARQSWEQQNSLSFFCAHHLLCMYRTSCINKMMCNLFLFCECIYWNSTTKIKHTLCHGQTKISTQIDLAAERKIPLLCKQLPEFCLSRWY